MNLEIRIAIIGILWAIFWLYWLIPAARSKQIISTKTRRYVGHVGLVWIACAIFTVIILQVPGVLNLFASYGFSNPALSNSVLGYIGILICIAGMVFAIRARSYLGRNWNPPMTLPENPKIITSGPYALVRHPIYSGALLAIFGTALFLGGLWFFVVLFFLFCVIVVSAKREEQLLTKQFPDEYPEYKKRTKALIPFI
jgi:protein-S-isoprenylcysteine O-methyltransferase Ste14